MTEEKNVNDNMAQEQFQQDTYDMRRMFAQMQKQMLKDITSNSSESAAFTKYTQSQIVSYLASPGRYQNNLVEASNYFYNNSNHYKRLIQYYAYLPTYAYILQPLKYDANKAKSEAYKKQFYKVANEVAKMNLRQSLEKASVIALREGVFYGVIRSNNDTWFLQQINPKFCQLTSIVNGTWMYAVDFSKIKEADLFKYPEEFTSLYHDYQDTGNRWQEVPDSISFCIKADETTVDYSLPPFVSTIPLLYSIENYKELYEAAAEIANYKLINLVVPTDNEGKPTMTWNQAMEWYAQVKPELPPYIGLSITPMQMDTVDFDKSATDKEVDLIAQAENTFWSDSGTSPLLFGSGNKNSAGALKLSIRADESVAFAILKQEETLINRYLLNLSGATKFKIQILPVTRFNKEEFIKEYRDLAKDGYPVKSIVAAAAGLQPIDYIGMEFMETEVLSLDIDEDGASTDKGGRPLMKDEDLTESGTQTREDDQNANR